MFCPHCGKEWPEDLVAELLDPEADWSFCGICPHCDIEITPDMLRQQLRPSDCLLVREGDIKEDEFCSDFFCPDCHASCALASKELDIEYTQDEEGNWGYDE